MSMAAAVPEPAAVAAAAPLAKVSADIEQLEGSAAAESDLKTASSYGHGYYGSGLYGGYGGYYGGGHYGGGHYGGLHGYYPTYTTYSSYNYPSYYGGYGKGRRHGVDLLMLRVDALA